MRILLFMFLSLSVLGQDEQSVESSLWGAQVGTIPASIYNERQIFRPDIAIRYDVNIEYEYKNGLQKMPVNLGAELRWYYNLIKDSGKGNSSPFLSSHFLFSPGFSLLHEGYAKGHFIIHWGYRKIFLSNFSFEATIGFIYSIERWEHEDFLGKKVDGYDENLGVNFRLAIGIFN